jgi:hypothetical protein
MGHKATPEQWAAIERWSRDDNGCSCIIELRARVEVLTLALKDEADCNTACVRNISERLRKLEANSKPIPNPSQTGRSLVERVQGAIHDVEFPHGNDEACAAIREVLAWLKEGEHTWAALKLEQEASP